MASVVWGNRLTGQARTVLVRAVVVLLAANAVALVVHDDGSSAPSGPEASGDVPAGADGGPVAGAPTEPGTATNSGAPSGGGEGGGDGAGGQVQASGPVPAVDPSKPTTTTTTEPPPVFLEDYTYEAVIDSPCLPVAKSFTVTMRVKPFSTVGFIVAYADGDMKKTQDTMYGGQAPKDGVIVRTFPAHAGSEGPGQVLTSVTYAENERTYHRGNKTIDFRIVGVLEKC